MSKLKIAAMGNARERVRAALDAGDAADKEIDESMAEWAETMQAFAMPDNVFEELWAEITTDSPALLVEWANAQARLRWSGA